LSILTAVDGIHQKLRDYESRGLRLFSTSSFQTHSIPLLHVLSTSGLDIPIYFLHTGFHFPETLAFRNLVAERLGIQVISLSSPVPKVGQRDAQGKFLYTSDPDRCCYLNKVMPLEPILQTHDVWINGVRKEQTGFRQTLQEEVPGAFDTLHYHPILDWTSKMIWEYRKQYDLPEHPLDAKDTFPSDAYPVQESLILRWQNVLAGGPGSRRKSVVSIRSLLKMID
jgi:phosphoadenosine phosphosulfate reductase